MYMFLAPLLLQGVVQCGRDTEALSKAIGKEHMAHLSAKGRVGRTVRDAEELSPPSKKAANEDDSSGYYFEDTDEHATKIKSVVGRVTSEADSAASKARKVSAELNKYMAKLNELFSQLSVMTEKQNAYVAKINADALAEEGTRNQAFEELDRELQKKHIGVPKKKQGASLEQKSLTQEHQVSEDEVERLKEQIKQLEASVSPGNRATPQTSLAKSTNKHGSLLETEEISIVSDVKPNEDGETAVSDEGFEDVGESLKDEPKRHKDEDDENELRVSLDGKEESKEQSEPEAVDEA